jgi:hypothetical protein
MENLLIAPFTKIDKEQRIVSGYATLEVPDKTTPVPEVVDYQSAKAAFGRWVGNIREMHLPIAVGKAIEIVPDDEKRGIYISAKISTSRDGQDAWTKIQEGVLTAFSIGMKGVKRAPETVTAGGKSVAVNRITFQDLAETSLVDNPACPGTFFDAVKAVLPAAEAVAGDAATAGRGDAVKTDNDPNVGGGVDRDKLPASDFVDPARRRFPIVTAGDVMDAVHSYGRAKPQIPFATFKRRLTAIAKRKGFEGSLPAEWKDSKFDVRRSKFDVPFLQPERRKAVAAGLKCEACDIQTALAVLGGICALLDSETGDQALGEDEQDDIDALLEAFERVQQFVGQEMGEMLADRAPAAGGDAQAAAAPDAAKADAAPAGRGDAAPAQDSSAHQPISSSAPGKVEAPDEDARRAQLADAIKSAVAEGIAPLSEGLGKVEAAVGDLKGRVEKMEQLPAPGGPVLRPQDLAAQGLIAAEKGGAPAQGAQAQVVLAELAKAIDAETNALAKEKLGLLYGRLTLKLGIR